MNLRSQQQLNNRQNIQTTQVQSNQNMMNNTNISHSPLNTTPSTANNSVSNNNQGASRPLNNNDDASNRQNLDSTTQTNVSNSDATSSTPVNSPSQNERRENDDVITPLPFTPMITTSNTQFRAHGVTTPIMHTPNLNKSINTGGSSIYSSPPEEPPSKETSAAPARTKTASRVAPQLIKTANTRRASTERRSSISNDDADHMSRMKKVQDEARKRRLAHSRRTLSEGKDTVLRPPILKVTTSTKNTKSITDKLVVLKKTKAGGSSLQKSGKSASSDELGARPKKKPAVTINKEPTIIIENRSITPTPETAEDASPKKSPLLERAKNAIGYVAEKMPLPRANYFGSRSLRSNYTAPPIRYLQTTVEKDVKNNIEKLKSVPKNIQNE